MQRDEGVASTYSFPMSGNFASKRSKKTAFSVLSRGHSPAHVRRARQREPSWPRQRGRTRAVAPTGPVPVARKQAGRMLYPIKIPSILHGPPTRSESEHCARQPFGGGRLSCPKKPLRLSAFVVKYLIPRMAGSANQPYPIKNRRQRAANSRQSSRLSGRNKCVLCDLRGETFPPGGRGPS